MTTKTAATTPLEWLHALGSSLNEFYEAQCKAYKAKKREGPKIINSAMKRAPSTIQKPTISEKRRASLDISTPLKGKSPTTTAILTNEPATPLNTTNVAISSTPFTETRSRRTAAAKADKYIDIVSRRLAEVPANGSTPKSMKIASKLISEATPNTRRNILLSSSIKRSSVEAVPPLPQPSVQSTPKTTICAPVVIPAATPASVRKRNRTAKIRQLFETPLLSLASAANTMDNAGTFSPSSVNVAPSTISKTSKLSQVHTAEKISPIKVISSTAKTTIVKSKVPSPVKTKSPAKKAPSPVKKAPSSPVKTKSPVRRSPRVSPFKAAISAAPVTVSATPKAPVVEFVAPQSVLRSSKRPRKQGSIFNDDTSTTASPALAKHARIANDPSIFPTVNFNAQTHVKITPQTPSVPVASVAVAAPPSVRTSNVNVPAIIVPLSTVKAEESSSTEDLTAIVNSKKTPLRVQPPAKTPTRAKAVIPSLSDYSTAAKIAVIEVSKNSQNNNNNGTVNSVAATPKVEPWTNRFMQKENAAGSTSTSAASVLTTTAPSAFIVKSSLNITVKPVDTSKISGFSSTSVPVVPKFPLNLANISNITKSSSSIISAPVVNNPPTATAAPSAPPAKIQIAPPESPLTRAKRIDSENSIREKTMMEQKDEKLKKEKSTVDATAGNTPAPIPAAPVTVNSVVNSNTSKLPVKPKGATTILPSPKIPSRLAEAFSGIDSELPPIDIGLVDDEKVLKNVLNGNSAVKEKEILTTTSSTASSTAPAGFVNPKMKKNPAPIVALNSAGPTSEVKNTNINSAVPTPSSAPSASTSTTTAAQLHRTAVLNSAARKVNADNTKIAPVNSTSTATTAITPSTPKPVVNTVTKTDSSSPFLPEIPSDDELERREKMKSASGKENRPTWATTPNLAVALNAQRSQRAEDVFGKVQPIKLEDFFKGSGKKFPNRSSTSNWNHNI